MHQTSSTAKSALLADLPPYIYGTTRLGDDQIPFDDRVRMARAAMDAGIWFHTSHTYGNALEVLRAAFDQGRARVPKLIVKIIGNTVDELRTVIRQNLKPLGVDNIELGQLCLGGELADDFARGGDCYQAFSRLKQEGLVRRFVLEVFPWTSDVALKALRGGYPEGIVDGCIFYLNPLQRFASNELWDLIRKRNEPVIALRTVSGGNVHRLRDVPGAAWKEYLQRRAVEVAPIFERSGIKTWTEFCLRFAHSFPQVRATVGATSRPENFREFLSAKDNLQPLPADIMNEIVKLQYRWSDDTDIHAEPWSM
jgi:aryl-alcohol dehydrogenase-like predicted oxidoreductase